MHRPIGDWRIRDRQRSSFLSTSVPSPASHSHRRIHSFIRTVADFKPEFIVVVVFIGGIIRLLNIGGESLWYDEAFTAWLAKLPPSQAMQAIYGDVHPPLSYFISRIFISILGNSEFSLRLPSVIFGSLSIWLVYRIALGADFKKSVALMAGILVAFMPGHIYYSQDARMYTLLTCCVLLAALGIFSRQFSLFFVGAAAGIYTHNLGWFYMGVLGVYGLWHWRGKKDQIFLYVWGAAAAGVGILWIPSLLHQSAELADGFWIQQSNLGGLLSPGATLTMGWRSPQGVLFILYVVAFTTTILSGWMMIRARRVDFLIVVFAAPILIFVAGYFWRPVFLTRGILPAVTMMMIVWAFALDRLKDENLDAAVIGISLCLMAGISFHFFGQQREPIRDWANIIKENWESGDRIFYPSISAAVLMGYYLHYPYTLRSQASDLNQTLSEETKSVMGFPSGRWDDLPAGRIWLIYGINPMSRSDEIEFLKVKQEGREFFFLKTKWSEVGIYLIEKGTMK